MKIKIESKLNTVTSIVHIVETICNTKKFIKNHLAPEDFSIKIKRDKEK